MKRKTKEAIGAGLTAFASAGASYRALSSNDATLAWLSAIAAGLALILTLMLAYDAVEGRGHEG